jgi:hypothetical protein
MKVINIEEEEPTIIMMMMMCGLLLFRWWRAETTSLLTQEPGWYTRPLGMASKIIRLDSSNNMHSLLS